MTPSDVHAALNVACQALEISLDHFDEIEIDGEMVSPYDVLVIVRKARDSQSKAPHSHRNGENEAPAVSGIYFYQGLPGSGWAEGIAEIEPHGMENKLVVWRAWVDGWDYLPQATVRWWGPISPPWRE